MSVNNPQCRECFTVTVQAQVLEHTDNDGGGAGGGVGDGGEGVFRGGSGGGVGDGGEGVLRGGGGGGGGEAKFHNAARDPASKDWS
ncbi:unnamed protein product [Echinostoma caproni]|uniref:Uncharacterized protein n=1 Tax=Echinostoma caproni TaxID=27848 RepID=A0A183AC82_9TREM|nr:unnamed protein product [Echinostoma caproni]